MTKEEAKEILRNVNGIPPTKTGKDQIIEAMKIAAALTIPPNP